MNPWNSGVPKLAGPTPPSLPWWTIKSPVMIRRGTRGTLCIPFQLVTVLNSLGPVIRSQVVSFFFSSSPGLADIWRFTLFCRILFAPVGRIEICWRVLPLRANEETHGLSTAKMKALMDLLLCMLYFSLGVQRLGKTGAFR